MHEMTQRRGDHRFVFGLFTGTLVGAGLAMWLAPRASEKYQQASAHVGRKVAEFTRRGRDVRDDIAGAVARGAHEVAHGALEVERVAIAATSRRVVDAKPSMSASTP
jgi:gas vesicle protein